jgi:hypothetical protein
MIESCPQCESTDLRRACCGDQTVFCNKCGYRWDSGIPTTCPVRPPLEPTAEVPEPCGVDSDDVMLMDDGEGANNKLWGE